MSLLGQDDYQARLRRALRDDLPRKPPSASTRAHNATKLESTRQPVRPKTAQNSSTLSTAALTLSPRQASSIAASPRCNSTTPTSPRAPGRRQVASAPLSSRIPTETIDDTSSHNNYTSSSGPRDYSQQQIGIDTKSREHLEIKSCLLAYMHRINVDEMQRVSHENRLVVDRSKVQQLISHGGVLDDGTVLDAARRKTVFLLRHFFSMDVYAACASMHHWHSETDPNFVAVDQSRGSRDAENKLLYDVVEEWACRCKSTPEAIAAVWRSITRHIEQSYFLRRTLVAHEDPDRVSITIAMDCLKKLSAHLPDYQRVLDVSLTLVESGLFQPGAAEEGGSSSRCDDRVSQNRRFYFQEVRLLRESLDEERQKMATVCQASQLSDERIESSIPLRERVIQLLDQMRDGDSLESEELFLSFLHGNMDLLASLACSEALKYFISHPSPAKRDFFYSLLMHQLDSDAAERLFSELLQSNEAAFKKFLHENFPAMNNILVDCNDAKKTSLFHRLIDRHPSEFAAVLWQSPYLTAHIFQGSQHLIARILEQNSFLVSHTLAQKSDLFLSLMNQALRDNTTVMEEFIVNHPRALSDLLVNRAPAIADVVKTKQFILTDLLQACRATLGKSLTAAPEVLLHSLRTNPDLLSFIIRSDDNILATIFKLAPQCLSDALEKHPGIFVDIAHRKPNLVTRLFTEHPDLLLEPFEANPVLLTTFLAMHRSQLPDFSDPNFDAMMLHVKSKKPVDASMQTDRMRVNSNAGKSLGKTHLLDEQNSLLQFVSTLARKTADPGTLTRVGRPDGAGDMEALPTPGELVSDIARLYVAKIDADYHDDMISRKHQALSDFVLDVYLGELGFMAAARQKLARVLLAVRRSGGIQESVRIKWFERFLHATPDEKPMPTTALDFYLAILQQLIPADRLASRLADEPYHACVISHISMRALIDHGLVSRLLETKDQRRRLLLLQTSVENEGSYFAETAGPLPKMKAKSIEVLHVDDVLDAVMNVWVRYQQRVKDEWTAAFQLMTPDGSGVVHVNLVKTVVRTRMPTLDTRAIMKMYHSCGQENELGEHELRADEFALAMTVLQEQHALRKLAPVPSST